MEQQLEPLTWQDLLKQFIENPSERVRLAMLVKVSPVTLQRWVNQVSRPREENVRALLRALPISYSDEFARLILQDFPGAFQEYPIRESVLLEMPSDLYARVLAALALTPLPMCRQTIQNLVLQQAISQLDTRPGGLLVNLVCCIPPRPGRKVRSLREVGGMGTLPWACGSEQKTMLLGAESLAGHMVIQHRPLVINSRREITFFPANWTKYEYSVAAFPIMAHARVAGGLLVSSNQEHFFTSERVTLLEDYSHLAALIFEEREFYSEHDIELGVMPSEDLQVSWFRSFNQRVSQKFADALLTHNRMTLQEARLYVLQDLEDELLRLSFHMNLH